MKRAMLVIIILTTFAAVGATPRSSTDRLLLVASSMDLSLPCKSKCVPCNNGLGHELVADTAGPLSRDVHECERLDPCDDKGVCGPEAPQPVPDDAATTMPEVEGVRLAVLEARYEDLAGMVRTQAGRISVNEARSAIQLIDCAGEVAAHFPIPNSATAVIAKMLQ